MSSKDDTAKKAAAKKKLDAAWSEVAHEQNAESENLRRAQSNQPAGSAFQRRSPKTASRRHNKSQAAGPGNGGGGAVGGDSATANAAAARPQINAPHKAATGSVPREVLVERKRREFAQGAQSLSELLLDRGLDLAAASFQGELVQSMEQDLPLAAFDDQEYERHTDPDQWLALGRAISGAQQGVPAQAASQHARAYQTCLVLSYSAESAEYGVQWTGKVRGA
jgi:hypothetical protein